MNEKPEEIKVPDQQLREWIVEKVLNYHHGHQADTKRLRQDCESLYDFIVKHLK